MRTHSEQKPPGQAVGDVVDCRRIDGTAGELDGRIEVELHGHGHRYLVRVVTGPGGPRLTELTITSPADEPITYDVLRAVPARRLAYAAADWASRYDGAFVGVQHLHDDNLLRRPEVATSRNKLDDKHFRDVAERVRAAVAIGAPVRETVAAAMHTTVPTLDRWIRTAKNRGYLGEHDIPRRKRPTGGTQR